jgi:hypothetical protein
MESVAKLALSALERTVASLCAFFVSYECTPLCSLFAKNMCIGINTVAPAKQQLHQYLVDAHYDSLLLTLMLCC